MEKEARKIIIDCDPGIDDAVALAVGMTDPQFDLRLISTVAGNVTVDKTTNNALKLVKFFNKDVPVVAGAASPLVKPFEDAARIHGESGMEGYDFGPVTTKPLAQPAPRALRDAIMQVGHVTLVATGAYTNVAVLLHQYPEVKDHIDQIVAMGGSLVGGNMTSVAEFNVFTDPDAAQMMYQSGVPIVMVGLDVTLKALVTPTTVNHLKELNEAGRMLASLMEHYNDGDNEWGHPIHDLNTLFYLAHPEAYTTQSMWVDIQTNGPAIGATVGDIRAAYHHGRVNADVCVDVDANMFNSWLVSEVQQMKGAGAAVPH